MAGNRRVLALRALRDRALELHWQQAMDLADELRAFAVFCERFVSITTDIPGQRIHLRWNDIQARLMALRRAWDIVLKARQVGLTTLELARDLWFALTRPSVAVAIIVPPHKENLPRRKLISTLKDMIAHLNRPIGAEWSGATVRLANGSTLTVFDAGGSEEAASKMGRGGTYHRVHVTELAHYPYAKELPEALVAAVPRPERGGEFIIESTPRGVGGSFHEMWSGALAGVNGFTPHFFEWFWMAKYRTGADECPAVPGDEDEKAVVRAALAHGLVLSGAALLWWRQTRNTIGRRKMLQEYPHDPKTCFLLAGESYFDALALDRLDAACRPCLSPQELAALGSRATTAQFFVQRLATLAQALNRSGLQLLRAWEPPLPGCSYVIPVDCAGGGVNGDWLVAPVLRRTPITLPARAVTSAQPAAPVRYQWRHVATLRARVPPPEFARWVQLLALAYGGALVAVERNGHGGTVLHVLEHELEYTHLYRDAKLMAGWYTGPHNRLPAIDDLADALQSGDLESYDTAFAAEARTFVVHKDGKVAGDKGCTDDVVMAMSIGWAVLHGPRSPRKGAHRGLVPQAAP